MSLTAVTLRAVIWTSAARIAQQLFQFGLMIYLMRALGPKAFGLVGIVAVFSGFAGLFTDFGFSAALVQRKDLKEEHRSSAFWLSLLAASTLGVLLCLSSHWIATFYEEELLGPITVWMALGLILGAFGAVPRALLEKAMRFKTLALIDSCGLLVRGSAAIAAALLGAGVWCLVIEQLVGAAVVSAGLLVMGGWRPRWMWSRTALNELLGFGAGLTGFGVINYWARSADKLLIGTFFGPVALGVYFRAYSLMLLPITQFVRVLSPVMFPALSTIQDDKPRVRAAFLRALNLLTFATFPMMTGLCVVAEPFVLGLLGAEWAEVVPLIQILSFVGVTQSVCNPVGWLYLSQGRTDRMFWWGAFSGGFLVLTIVMGVWFGSIQAVAVAYLIGNIIVTGPCLSIPGRLVEMTLWDVWRMIRGNLLAALGMAAIVWSAGTVISTGAHVLIELAVEVCLGVAAYLFIAWAFRLRVLGDIRGLLAARGGHAV